MNQQILVEKTPLSVKVQELTPNTLLLEDYLLTKDWAVKENANTGYSLQGLNNYLSTKIVTRYWLDMIYPATIRQAHDQADFHIHDLGTLGPYCMGWDLKDVLLLGFQGVRGKVESKPAKHFRTALMQMVNFLYTLQGESAGAQAFSNVDTLLAPFIYYDKLQYSDVKQAMQEFIFNLAVPTRVGFQTPFTNITLDLTCPQHMKSEPVIIGGKYMSKTYGEFSQEMLMFNRAYAEVMIAGDATGKIFTFPIPTFNISKDFDWDNPEYEVLWEMTAKYGIPYFSNFVNSDMKPEDARSMCCRLRLNNVELRSRGGGLFGANPLTGSIGVVTINLPRIGYVTKSKQEFLDRLDSLLFLAKDSLELKRRVVEDFTATGLYPYSKFYLKAMYERTGKYWHNHFSTIGILGMNEAMLNFMDVPLTHPKAQDFALEIMRHIKHRLQEFQTQSGMLYNLEATPGESTTYRFAKADVKRYPQIRVANPGHENPYYTNSTHLPVNYTDDIFHALEVQDPLQIEYTGGTVHHIFVGEAMSPASAKKLVKLVCNSFKLPYFTITPTFSICPIHGYIAGDHEFCPHCEDTNENTM